MSIANWGGSRSGAGHPYKKITLRDGETYTVNTPDGPHTGVARVVDKNTVILILDDLHEIEIIREL